MLSDREHLAQLQQTLRQQKMEMDARADEQSRQMAQLGAEKERLAAMRAETEAEHDRIERLVSSKAAYDADVRNMRAALERKQADLQRQATDQSHKIEQWEAEKARVAQSGSMEPVQLAANNRIKDLESQMQRSQSQVSHLESSLAERSVQAKQAVGKTDALKQEISSIREKTFASSRNDGPAVEAVPTEPVAAESLASGSSGNDRSRRTLSRASEFLNRIMAYHVPAGMKDRTRSKDTSMARLDADMDTSPVVTPDTLASTSPSTPLEKSAATAMNVLEPAAGAALSSAPSGSVTLEELLNSSGVAINNFVPVEQTEDTVVSQWTSGKINGMHEQVASSGSFEGQVKGYIDRYRQDCGDSLTVRSSAPETGKIGTTATVDIECKAPSNSYVSSFVFLQDGSGFSTIVHTAYPTDKEAVRSARDSILQTLKSSSGFVAPQMIKHSASAAPLKLNIAAPEKSEPAVDGMETVVIQ